MRNLMTAAVWVMLGVGCSADTPTDPVTDGAGGTGEPRRSSATDCTTSNTFNHAWRVRDGGYLLTDDPNFRPGLVGLEGQKLRRVE